MLLEIIILFKINLVDIYNKFKKKQKANNKINNITNNNANDIANKNNINLNANSQIII